MANSERIVVVAPNWLGDAVMSLPALADLRRHFAGVRLAVAARASVAPLFTLVDHSTVWAMLQVPEATLARVKVGQPVELRVDSLPGKVFTGKLTWIGPAVDERTRMVRARAEFANPDRLRVVFRFPDVERFHASANVRELGASRPKTTKRARPSKIGNTG